MIIVPIKGDKITTVDGLPYKVLSYSNLNSDGPVVFVDSAGGSDQVLLQNIVEINGKKVTLIKSAEGYNVLEADGFFDRKYHLPQVGEKVKSGISEIEERTYEVIRLRLHVDGKLSAGLILNTEEEGSKAKVELSLGDLTDIDRPLFSLNGFLRLYDDYVRT
jgi:hypothetical protein